MKRVAGFLVFLMLSFGAVAKGKEQTDQGLAIEYLKMARFEQSLDLSLDTYQGNCTKPESLNGG